MLRYFWPSDDEQLAGQFVGSYFVEDGDWWAGVQRAGATLALGVALTLSAASTAAASLVFSQSQDDPAGNLLVVPPIVDELYWQNSVQPVVWPQPSVFTADDTFLTLIQTTPVDELYWQNSVPPIAGSQFLVLPFLDPEELPQFPAATNHLDDAALWTPNIPPAELDWNVLFFLDDGSWVPAMEPDEDFWAPQILPQLWAQPQQPFNVGDDTEFPRPGQMDELYWQNQSAPVALSFAPLQQSPFEQNDPAGSLRTTVDELYWQNPVTPVVWPQPSVFTSDEFPPSFTPVFQVDEDFWTNPVPAVAASNRVQLPFNVEEPPHPTLTTAVPDEVFWIPSVPLQAVFQQWNTPPVVFTEDQFFQSNAPPPFVPPVVTPGSLLGLFGYNRNI